MRLNVIVFVFMVCFEHHQTEEAEEEEGEKEEAEGREKEEGQIGHKKIKGGGKGMMRKTKQTERKEHQSFDRSTR